MTTRKKLGLACMILGAVLLASAVALLAYNRWDDWRAGKAADEIQSALKVVMVDLPTETTEAEEPYTDETAAEPEEEPRVMNTVEIDGDEYIGILTIPSLALELPIMADWSYPKLKTAPCRFSGSVWTDDMVICGHNYSRHFGNLKYLEQGNTVIFTDVDGNVFSYEVAETVILQPTDVEELLSQDSGDWDLTLVTCTLGGKTRVTVRCVLAAE
ncbi:MAG: sortase [Oscillospiraceae bacterium]|nr:sortase [Oscillospiraceae bacterium]